MLELFKKLRMIWMENDTCQIIKAYLDILKSRCLNV